MPVVECRQSGIQILGTTHGRQPKNRARSSAKLSAISPRYTRYTAHVWWAVCKTLFFEWKSEIENSALSSAVDVVDTVNVVDCAQDVQREPAMPSNGGLGRMAVHGKIYVHPITMTLLLRAWEYKGHGQLI